MTLPEGWEYDSSPQPVPFKRKDIGKRIAIVDCETDPFAPGCVVRPFALGFLTDDRYIDFWGNDCVEQFFAYLETLEDEFVIYAHNGGKFDFFFFLKHLSPNIEPMIISGRLVKIFFGGQEFRDSFAIIPERLANYKKDDIDYAKFVPELREQYKKEILEYQKKDCIYLWEQIEYFQNRFGDSLTIASVSMRMLNSYHGFEKFETEQLDENFRPFYYGGRCQCFETGILKGNWLIVDRNSMYPAVMKDYKHPISKDHIVTDRLTDETDFALIRGWNKGCLPTRNKGFGLDFTAEYGEFYATIHEINAGIETGTLKIESVIHAWEFAEKSSFGDFVDDYYNMRLDAKARGDRLDDLNTKRVMNSSYGKFALNCRNFKNYTLTINSMPSPLASELEPEGWSLVSQQGDICIWERPNPKKTGYYNVATASSITGAARAELLYALAASKRPIYCDTDSVICEDFTGDIDETKLGGWKIEAVGDMAAIAGKKLYAVFNAGEKIKLASKGCVLTPNEIIDVCNGNEIKYKNPVPAFSLVSRNRNSVEMERGGFATFINRNINMTGNIETEG